jgi:hypothetical protein
MQANLHLQGLATQPLPRLVLPRALLLARAFGLVAPDSFGCGVQPVEVHLPGPEQLPVAHYLAAAASIGSGGAHPDQMHAKSPTVRRQRRPVVPGVPPSVPVLSQQEHARNVAKLKEREARQQLLAERRRKHAASLLDAPVGGVHPVPRENQQEQQAQPAQPPADAMPSSLEPSALGAADGCDAGEEDA